MENFWNALINCEINLILTWSNRCFIIENPIYNQEPTFTVTDRKLYVPIVALSSQDDAKLLEKLKSGFKRTTNWNKYESKSNSRATKPYLDFLINLSLKEWIDFLFYHLKMMIIEEVTRDIILHL